MSARQIEGPADSTRAKNSGGSGLFWIIVLLAVLAVVVTALLFAKPWSPEKQRRMKSAGAPDTNAAPADSATATVAITETNSPAPKDDNVVLTVSGYIINRERIEISPRFLGVVQWIGVEEGRRRHERTNRGVAR